MCDLAREVFHGTRYNLFNDLEPTLIEFAFNLSPNSQALQH